MKDTLCCLMKMPPLTAEFVRIGDVNRGRIFILEKCGGSADLAKPAGLKVNI